MEEEEIRAASFGIDLSEAHIFINLKLQMADVDPFSSAWGIKRTVYFHGLKEELRKRQLSLRIIQHGEKDILFLSAKNEMILQESGKMLPLFLSRYMDVRQHLKYMQELVGYIQASILLDSAITRRNLRFKRHFHR